MKTYDPSHIRSFALIGHGGAGKTSIGDALARLTGLNNRLGSVSDKSSLLDFEPEEQERGGSVSVAFLTCEREGFKTHVIDTPGDGDFLHDGMVCLQGVDAAVLVISAIDGVETATEKMNEQAARFDLPRAIFINKLDRERAEIEGPLKDIKELLGLEPVLLQLPIGKEDAFRGVVDLLARKAYVYSDDSGQPKAEAIPADMADEVQAAYEAMAEAIASCDDELIEKYLEEGELSEAELEAGLVAGLKSGALAPVLLGSAVRNIGVDRLLALARSFPSPLDRPIPALASDEADAVGDAQADPNGPLVALCFRSIIDPFMGHLSIFRVFSGSATTDSSPKNVRVGREERLGSIFHLVGKKNVSVDKVVPGDIFAVPKLKFTDTSDTLADAKAQGTLRWIEAPEPMIAYVLRPKSRTDEDKMRTALQRTLAEDPGLRQTFDDVTKEIVLSGMGTNHLQMSVLKMKRKYGVEVEFGTPTIPYRETIGGKADVRYRHKKQTGGAGQFGEVAIRIEPNPNEGYEFVDAIVGGVIPSALIPSVDKGVRGQLEKGILAGFPVQDLKVSLYDGKYHPVDSKDIAFQIAGRQAIKQAVLQARPILLEPIQDVEVICPEENVGDIMGDMNTRRAKIQSMGSRGNKSVVKAYVPLAEMLNYSPPLKSMTGGRGSFTMVFSSYEHVPMAMQDDLVKKVSRLRQTDDE